MTVRVVEGIIRLEGACRAEEAEPLTALLQAELRPVDLSACAALHAAVAQVLLAFAPELRGEPADAFLRERLAPALAGARNGAARATIGATSVIEEAGPLAGGRTGEGAQV
ncbi:hypothetical protein [Phenylobacterium sp.]|uniref:hypothetical protein n=1 Tax=Phenylobacterium sp. TaxID=1871053 RepID=UPI0035B42726